MDSDGGDRPEWTNELHGNLVQSLRDAHQGDCTCVPCSCPKCWAEVYLDIDTIPGLDKHMAYKVACAFQGDAERTLDQVIAALTDYNPEFSWGWNHELWDSCLPRWREEAAQARAWLVAYRAEHFDSKEPSDG